MNTINPTPEALKLQEVLKTMLPEEGYFLMGLHERTTIWPRATRTDMLAKTKPVQELNTGERSAELLSTGQVGFFGNLHNCTKVENLNDFNMEPRLISDTVDPTVKKLILGGKRTNKLGQPVIKLTCIIWREYTPEEKAEYARKKELAQAAELGYAAPAMDIMTTLLNGF